MEQMTEPLSYVYDAIFNKMLLILNQAYLGANLSLLIQLTVSCSGFLTGFNVKQNNTSGANQRESLFSNKNFPNELIKSTRLLEASLLVHLLTACNVVSYCSVLINSPLSF